MFQNLYDTPVPEKKYLVKRCYAIPGDTLKIWTPSKSISQQSLKDTVRSKSILPLEKSVLSTFISNSPVITPKAGLSILLSKELIYIYKEIILFENPKILSGDYFKDAENGLITYTFKYNYYFMLGDNFYNSLDSRHFGFVAESDIIGKVILLK